MTEARTTPSSEVRKWMQRYMLLGRERLTFSAREVLFISVFSPLGFFIYALNYASSVRLG